jgi:hypothetical protein
MSLATHPDKVGSMPGAKEAFMRVKDVGSGVLSGVSGVAIFLRFAN